MEFAEEEAEQREAREMLLMHEASSYATGRLLRTAVAAWRDAVQETKQALEEQALKEQRRNKIDGWLQEHRSTKQASSDAPYAHADFLQVVDDTPQLSSVSLKNRAQ